MELITLAEQYRLAVEQQDSKKILAIMEDFIEYLKQVLKETSEPFNNISDFSYRTDLVLQLMALNEIDFEKSSHLFDFLQTMKSLEHNPHLHSILVHMMNHTHDYLEDKDDGRLMNVVGPYSIVYSFQANLYILPKAKSGPIWVPDYSFLRKKRPRELMPEPLGKGALERPLLFSPSTTLPMLKSYWNSDIEDVHYFSRTEKKRFKVRKTDTPFVLKRNIDDKKMPKGQYIFALSMHGGLIASELNRVTVDGKKFIHHSTLRAGQNVKAAGNFMVNKQGIITEIDGCSGHYRTPDFNLIETVLYLFNQGFMNDECKIKCYDDVVYRSKKALIKISVKELLSDDKLRFDSEDIQSIVDEAIGNREKPVHRTFRLN